MAWRATPALLLLQASLVLADTDELFRRAETRLAHRNREGARALLLRVIEEDPCHGPALVALARLDRDVQLCLAWLERGTPFDPSRARTFLMELRAQVVDLPEDLVLEMERGTLIATDAGIEPCGPWRPWERPHVLAPPTPPPGPLRQEVFGSRAHAHREALQRVAARWVREGVTDAVCWAELSALLRWTGDPAGAGEALARAVADSLEDRLLVAERALESVDDPCDWWRRNGPALLADLRAAATRGETVLSDRVLFPTAAQALAWGRDLRGFLDLAAAEHDCAAAGLDARAGITIPLLAQTFHLEEALEAATAWDDPSAIAVRASILQGMGRFEAALTLLESASTGPTVSLAVLHRLWRAQGAAGLDAEASRTEERLLRIASDRGFPVAERVRRERLAREGDEAEAIPWLRGLLASGEEEDLAIAFRWWAERQRTTPPDELIEAVLRAPRLPGWLPRACAGLALDSDRTEAAFDSMERIPVGDAELEDESRFDSVRTPRVLERFLHRLRVFAARPRLSVRQDAFLRWFIPQNRISEAPGPLRVRAALDLRHDAAFLRLPGGAYVVSLLLDPTLEAAEARRLRRRAYDSGFRPRGLLLDMAEDGEAVLAELAPLDPVSARLIAAVRSRGVEALERFLEEDEAWPAQLQRAHGELTARRATSRTAWSPPSTHRGEVARRAWELIESDPVRALATWEGRNRRSELTGRRDWRRIEEDPGILDEDVRHLVGHAEREGTIRGHECCRRALAEKCEEALRALFERPRGAAIARMVAERGNFDTVALSKAVNEEAARRPLDLRWVEVRLMLARLPGTTEDVAPLVAALLAERRRSPTLILAMAGNATTAAEALPLVRAWIDLAARGGAPGRWVTGLGLLKKWGDPALRDEALRRFYDECTGEKARSDLSRFAQELGDAALSAEWDRALARSDDADVRFCVLLRERKRDPTPRDPAASLAVAREPGWEERHVGPLLAMAAADAIEAGDAGRLAEALEEIWRGSLTTRYSVYPYNVDLLRLDTPRRQRSLEILLPTLRQGKAGLGLWSYVLMVPVAERPTDLASLRPEERLIEAGYVTRTAWSRGVVARGPGASVEEVRRVLSRIGGSRATLALGDWVRSAALGLRAEGREEEAIACLDAWAEGCGPLAISQRSGEVFQQRSNRPVVGWLQWQDCFGGSAMPPQVVAAAALDSIGLSLPAIRRLDEAASGEDVAGVAGPCRDARMVKALALLVPSLDHRRGRDRRPVTVPPETGRKVVRDLMTRMRSSAQVDLLQEAYAILTSLYELHPALRSAFVDDWLEKRPTGPAPSREEVTTWEARLASADAASREEAERELRALGVEAAGVLGLLRTSADPEVAARAEGILEELAAP